MTETTANKTQGAAPAYKRSARNLLIHKPMQREMSIMLISLLMISTLVVGYVIHSTIREIAMGGGYRFGKISVYDVLSDLSYQLVVRVSIVLFVTMVVIGFFGVFFLHRVAGPVYRFRRTFVKLNEGEIPHPIKLREGDFFAETASEINQLIKVVQFERDKVKQAKEKVDRMVSSPGDSLSKAAHEVKAILDSQAKDN